MNSLDLIDGLVLFAHPREDLLHDFVRGNVSLDMAKAMHLHLSRCSDCRELAELFGWAGATPASAKVVPISDASRAPYPSAWRTPEEDRIAAAHRTTGIGGNSDDEDGRGPVVEHIPGATDGSAALGYLCGGSSDVVVTGAADGSARVLLAGNEYPLAAANNWGIRVVEGMSRQDVTIWLARGGIRDGTFAVLHE